MSACTIRLPVFEGPPDLLLYLVEKRELQPAEVEVAAVAAQYRAQLRAIDRLDLDAASEILVTVARLLALKARSLLPAGPEGREVLPPDPPEPDEDGLLRDLEAYRLFRARAGALGGLAQAQALRFARPPLPALERGQVPGPVPPGEDLSPGDLAAAFGRAWNRHRRLARVIPAELLSVRRRMAELLRTLRNGGVAFFSAFCRQARSRGEVIVTFLALLELLRRRKITLTQPEPFADLAIGIRPRARAGSGLP